MFGIGGQELILLMLIGLVVLGPERLPRIANQIGGWLGQARRMTRVMKRQLEDELDFSGNSIKPPPPASREPSFQPMQEPPPPYEPNEDDTYSPEHAKDEPGSGVGDDDAAVDEAQAAADRAEADAELDAVLEASTATDDNDDTQKKDEAR